MSDLPIIQKTYNLIKWYVPILDRLPRGHKFLLENRIITELYDVLDGLIVARYAKQKLAHLEALNSKFSKHANIINTVLKYDDNLKKQEFQATINNMLAYLF